MRTVYKFDFPCGRQWRDVERYFVETMNGFEERWDYFSTYEGFLAVVADITDVRIRKLVVQTGGQRFDTLE